MQDLLGDTLLTNAGAVSSSVLESAEFVLLYFSAHWCAPCIAFTMKLEQFYQDVNASERLVEVVFVSCDRDEGSFRSYFEEMPWVSLPYSQPIRERLNKSFRVTNIPKLVLLKKNGDMATDTCRTDVETLGPRAVERWRKFL